MRPRWAQYIAGNPKIVWFGRIFMCLSAYSICLNLGFWLYVGFNSQRYHASEFDVRNVYEANHKAGTYLKAEGAIDGSPEFMIDFEEYLSPADGRSVSSYTWNVRFNRQVSKEAYFGEKHLRIIGQRDFNRRWVYAGGWGFFLTVLLVGWWIVEHRSKLKNK